MFCSNCGTQLLEAAKFCGSCGSPVLVISAAADSAVPVQQEPAPPEPVVMLSAEESEYMVCGEEIQFAEIMLRPGDSCAAKAGALMYVSSDIACGTVPVPGVIQQTDDAAAASSESVSGAGVMHIYTNTGSEKKPAAFTSPCPGRVIPFNLSEYGGVLICREEAFLCAAGGISAAAVQQKISEGRKLNLYRLEGSGLTFIHTGGTLIKKELESGETLRINLFCLTAFTENISFSDGFSEDSDRAVFEEKTCQQAVLNGPGTVLLQSLPVPLPAESPGSTN